MANTQERAFLRRYAPFTGKTVLEVGTSHDGVVYNREISEAKKHIGVDIRAHSNTDIVHDLSSPLSIEPVDAIICFSVLEHCARPWLVGENLMSVLKPGGLLLLTVPMWWRWHGYPDDYWRMTPSGVKIIFPDITWIEECIHPPVDIKRHTTSTVILLFAGTKNA